MKNILIGWRMKMQIAFNFVFFGNMESPQNECYTRILNIPDEIIPEAIRCDLANRFITANVSLIRGEDA
jgi:hypothetical protein